LLDEIDPDEKERVRQLERYFITMTYIITLYSPNQCLPIGYKRHGCGL